MIRAITLLCAAQLLRLACSTPPRPDRAQELAACRRISTDGDALGRCLLSKYHWDPASAGPAKAAWQRHLDSLRTGNVAPETLSTEQADAQVRRWVACVYQATGGDWEKQSIAAYNCRSDVPDVDALLRYTKTRPDSERLILDVYNAIER